MKEILKRNNIKCYRKFDKTRYFCHNFVNFLGASDSKLENRQICIDLSKPLYFAMKNKTRHLGSISWSFVLKRGEDFKNTSLFKHLHTESVELRAGKNRPEKVVELSTQNAQLTW